MGFETTSPGVRRKPDTVTTPGGGINFQSSATVPNRLKRKGVEPSPSVARDALAAATAMDLEDGLTALDKIVTQFNTYEDYLDSQITDEDLYYLEVRSAAPQSGHRLPVLGSLRVVGCLPPGGEGRASQFPAGGGESLAASRPLCVAPGSTGFGHLPSPGAETCACARKLAPWTALSFSSSASPVTSPPAPLPKPFSCNWWLNSEAC